MTITFILKIQFFKNIDTIKQIKIYPPEGNCCNVIVIYEVPDIIKLADNGKYLSIDLGLKNLMTCLNSETGETFIIGKKYLSLCRYYYKEIARIQSQWYHQQIKMDIKYPKVLNISRRCISRRIMSLRIIYIKLPDI